MMFINLRRTLTRIVSIMIIVSGFVMLAPINANAADDVTLTCKKSLSDAVLDFRSLGINISAAVPVGTVVHSGNLTVTFKCALDNLQQFLDGLTAEVYLKRKTIAEDALGYGLTIYTGYGGEMSTDAAIIPTGNKIATYALTSGGTVGSYTEVTLNVPFQIVRTSNSMAGPNLLPDYVNVFDVGSLVPGNDLKLYVRYIKSGITVRDQTCSAAGDVNPKVSLGSYTANTSSGLGSGIGQTSPSTAFNLQLNCEALLSGTFDVMMQLDGDAADGLSDVGVVSLNSTSTASGVGVQILNESQQPVALATPYRVAAYPLSSALITVPLYARYYQTAATITPGSANAVATYTISYQ